MKLCTRRQKFAQIIFITAILLVQTFVAKTFKINSHVGTWASTNAHATAPHNEQTWASNGNVWTSTGNVGTSTNNALATTSQFKQMSLNGEGLTLEEVQANYLIQPTHIAAENGIVFAYDSADRRIKMHNGTYVTDSIALGCEVLDISISDEILFVLAKQNNTIELKAFSIELTSITNPLLELNLLSEIELNEKSIRLSSCIKSDSSICLAILVQEESSFSIQRLDLEKESENLSVTSNFIISSFSGAPPENKISDIHFSTPDEIHLTSSDGVYLVENIVENTGNPEILSATISRIFSSSTVKNLTISNGIIIASSNENTIQINTDMQSKTIANISMADLCTDTSTNIVYSTDTIGQKIFRFNSSQDEEMEVFAQNNFSNPEKLSSEEILFAQTILESGFFKRPFDSVPEKTIPACTNLSILATENESQSNHYFCMFHDTTAKTNLVGYVSKTDVNILSTSPVNLVLQALVEIRLCTYPSPKIDENNPQVATLEKGASLTTIHNSANITVGGLEFYFVKTSTNQFGFVPKSQVFLKTSSNQVQTNTNATIKENAKLFQTKDGKGELLTLSKSSRIQIHARLNPATPYTKITFTDDQGNSFTGYVQTSLIQSDQLTTMQLKGVLLTVFSAGFLLVLFFVKRTLSKNSRV